MKKIYQTPATEITKVHVHANLLQSSIVKVSQGKGFSEEIEIGSTTTSADSRRGSFWDDEE